MAKGILVVPLEKLLIYPDMDGNALPRRTPAAIARNIHKVR
jgi:hypothetical protein